MEYPHNTSHTVYNELYTNGYTNPRPYAREPGSSSSSSCQPPSLAEPCVLLGRGLRRLDNLLLVNARLVQHRLPFKLKATHMPWSPRPGLPPPSASQLSSVHLTTRCDVHRNRPDIVFGKQQNGSKTDDFQVRKLIMKAVTLKSDANWQPPLGSSSGDVASLP